MEDNKSPKVEKDHDDEDKSEVLGNLVKVVVLIWSASLLTFSYVRLPNGQKIFPLVEEGTSRGLGSS